MTKKNKKEPNGLTNEVLAWLGRDALKKAGYSDQVIDAIYSHKNKKGKDKDGNKS